MKQTISVTLIKQPILAFKVNNESRESVNSIMKSLKLYEEMIRLWVNTTNEEDTLDQDSFKSRFDLKRKKLKDFLSKS